MSEFFHLTLPFHFETDQIPVDLGNIQFSSNQKPKLTDCQVVNSEKGKFILKKINQTNYVFRVRKFQHKLLNNVFCYKLEFETELTETQDPQCYFQDFHLETESEENILDQFKKFIKEQNYDLTKPNLPRDIAKPFCWRGSNFKFNLMKKHIRKNKIGKKSNIISIKFGEEVPQPNIYLNYNDQQLKQMFDKKPIWLKESLQKFLKPQQSIEQQLGQIAYYYYNGPWAKCYVSKHFNPLQDPLAALYQTITIKNRGNENTNSDNDEEVPQKSYFIVQLSDIHDKEVEKIINETIQDCKRAQESQFTEKYGWFRRNQLKALIRKIKSLKENQMI